MILLLPEPAPFMMWLSAYSRGLDSLKTTGSIICPIMPSARIITGVRYRSARSNASIVRSANSCAESGPRTMTR